MNTLLQTFCRGTTLVLLATAMSAAAFPASDTSFELRPAGSTLGGTTTFTSTGLWTINHGSYRGAENGITPLLGTNMLRFDEVSPEAGTDIYQLVDVSSFSSLISTGGVTFTLSASFNSPVAHGFALTMLAYFETTTPFSVNAYDGSAQLPLFTTLDADPSTWQSLSLNFTPPSGTHFIAIGVNSRVDGHVSYADAVNFTATVAPEPSIPALLPLGALCFLRRKFRRFRG